MELGIDKDNNFAYEGSCHWGHAIWPSPIIVPAAFSTSTSETLIPADGNLNPNSYVFYEDAFDPVSRIRRGRLLQGGGNIQPIQWNVYPHPAIPQEGREISRQGVLKKRLFTFHPLYLPNILKNLGSGQPIILLGTQKSFTLWTIVSVETTASGDELVILKSRQSFGALPSLHSKEIPEAGREKVIATLETLQEDIQRSGSESVIDRAREAATVILSTYLQAKKFAKPKLDLDALIKKFLDANEKDKKQIVINAADIVRIFHSRGKHVVQEKFPVRPICEQDAELAIQCVGTILCDLGWAMWR